MHLDASKIKAVCDFCLGHDVRWAYPVTDFAALPGEDNSGWAACDTCARLIEANDIEGLITRAAKRHARRSRDSTKAARSALRLVYPRFFAARGERVASDGTLEDPTHPDAMLRRMMQLPGGDFSMQVSRTAEALARDGAHKSVSKESVRGLADSAHDWILSRIYRRFEFEPDRPVHKVTMEIRVILDDDEPVDESITMVLPDVRHSDQ